MCEAAVALVPKLAEFAVKGGMKTFVLTFMNLTKVDSVAALADMMSAVDREVPV